MSLLLLLGHLGGKLLHHCLHTLQELLLGSGALISPRLWLVWLIQLLLLNSANILPHALELLHEGSLSLVDLLRECILADLELRLTGLASTDGLDERHLVVLEI